MFFACSTQAVLAAQRVPGIPLAISVPDRFIAVPIDQRNEAEGVRRIAIYHDPSSGSSIGVSVRDVPEFLTVEEVIEFLHLGSGQKYSKKRVVSSCGRKIGFLEGSAMAGSRPAKFMEAFYVIHDSSSNVVYTAAYTYPDGQLARDAIAAITCG